jgi:hypothetical protein
VIQGEIVVKIHEPGDVDFTIEYGEYVQLPETELQEIIRNFSTPLDLSQPPLMRVKLMKLEKEKYMILFDIHHIIRDDVSSRILLEELSALYKGDELPPLSIQYKDFAQWQQKFMESEAFRKLENHWLERFSGKVPLLNMPTDIPRPHMQDFEGEWIPFSIEPQSIDKIKKLGEYTGATLYMIMLAALNILLNRYTGQKDITISSPIMGRDHEELEGIIGLFINLLPMRNFPDPDKTFLNFLNEVRENALTAYENQAHPFANLVDKLGLDKDYSRNPLNDVELIMVNTDVSILNVQDLRFIPFEHNITTSMVDIAVEVTELPGRISFRLMYCTKLFKRETMERFIHNFKEVLEAVAQNKDIFLKDITISSSLEEAELVFKDDKEGFGF